MVKYLLFDFDGTLFDTGVGVMRCVQYALKKLGIEEHDEANLRKFIGPPLDEMFSELYGFSPETAREAVRLYRERYQPTGIWECEPYPGITDVLDAARKAGFRISVCTSKPTPSARKILERYGMTEKFDFICGSEFDGTRSKKYEVVQACLEHFGVTDTETVRMIGDRKYDILGAAKCGVKTVGVRFGYADPGELEAYGAEYIADTVPDLRDYLLQLNP